MAFILTANVIKIGTNPLMSTAQVFTFPISKCFVLSQALGGMGVSGANSTVFYDKQFYYATDSVVVLRAQIQAAGLSLVGMEEMATSGLTYAWATDAVASGSGGSGSVAKQMLTVVVGNSLAGYSSAPNAGQGDILISNMLSDAMYFKSTVSNSQLNSFGIYSYSGQTLTTILADLPTNFFPPIKTAGIIPDLCILHSLPENSIIQGHSFTLIQSQVTGLITNVQNRWPGVIIHLVCPRPATSYDTPAKVLVWQQLTTWYLSLDNSSNIFVSKADPYIDPANTGWPLPGVTDGIHPALTASSLLGRIQAASLKRIAKVFKAAYQTSSNNMSLTGSTAVNSVTGVTGTRPSSSVSFAANNPATVVALAEDPGMLLSYTVPLNAGANNILTITFDFGQISGLSLNQASAFVKFRIVSGAEILKIIQGLCIYTDGTGNNFVSFCSVSANTNQNEKCYQNGDIITMRDIGTKARTGTITAAQIYVYPTAILAGGSFVIEILSQGIGEVS